jgi:hypothetical protein
MNKKPGENSSLRRLAIYREYEKVIAKYTANHGILATDIAKGKLYTEVADALNYSVEYVRKVVYSFLKEKK